MHTCLRALTRRPALSLWLSWLCPFERLCKHRYTTNRWGSLSIVSIKFRFSDEAQPAWASTEPARTTPNMWSWSPSCRGFICRRAWSWMCRRARWAEAVGRRPNRREWPAAVTGRTGNKHWLGSTESFVRSVKKERVCKRHDVPSKSLWQLCETRAEQSEAPPQSWIRESIPRCKRRAFSLSMATALRCVHG